MEVNMSEEIKETYLKLPNVTVGELQDVVDFMQDEDIEYIEFYEKDLKQQILDLQQKVEQLESSITMEEYTRQVNLNIELSKKIEQLENIRKEAIKEIQRVLDIWTNKPNEIATLDLEYLLNILNKGSDK